MNSFFKKYTVFVMIGFIISFQAEAQGVKNMFARNPMKNKANFDNQLMHWGYFLGFNVYDFKIDMIDDAPPILVETTTGFNVGLVGNLRLHEYIDFRFEPGLYYTQRNLRFPGFDNEFDALREVKSTYIHFPFLLKFSSKRVGNVRPYLLGGLSYTLNLSSNFDAQDDNSQEIFRMKRWSPNYELGFGIDLYFEYFKFSPSIRGVFGIEDELIRDNDPNSPWTGNVASMKTRGVFINFTFH
jgi:hypothetical protein